MSFDFSGLSLFLFFFFFSPQNDHLHEHFFLEEEKRCEVENFYLSNGFIILDLQLVNMLRSITTGVPLRSIRGSGVYMGMVMGARSFSVSGRNSAVAEANSASGSTSSSTSSSTSTNTNTIQSPLPDIKLMKYDSIGSSSLYAVFRLHNIPYLVTKGDKVVIPGKIKNVSVGDKLNVTNVTTLGTPNFTYTKDDGIDQGLFKLTASVVEITREPYYEVYRKKQRCRRLKTFPVENFQTVLMINDLNLN